MTSAHWVSLVFKGVFQTPWVFARAGLLDVSNLDSIEGSALGGSFGVFCPSKLLAFHRPNSSVVSALVVSFLSLSARLAVLSGSYLSLCSLFSGII